MYKLAVILFIILINVIWVILIDLKVGWVLLVMSFCEDLAIYLFECMTGQRLPKSEKFKKDKK